VRCLDGANVQSTCFEAKKSAVECRKAMAAISDAHSGRQVSLAEREVIST
jgi:hypothetical protein